MRIQRMRMRMVKWDDHDDNHDDSDWYSLDQMIDTTITTTYNYDSLMYDPLTDDSRCCCRYLNVFLVGVAWKI